mmetsp:Transcript_27876/g.62210  ORF Transcript_27876/g.62210 Transcript_27876/m.62210 type:complete len:210 (-) Transcript_27876:590-1219(-)
MMASSGDSEACSSTNSPSLAARTAKSTSKYSWKDWLAREKSSFGCESPASALSSSLASSSSLVNTGGGTCPADTAGAVGSAFEALAAAARTSFATLARAAAAAARSCARPLLLSLSSHSVLASSVASRAFSPASSALAKSAPAFSNAARALATAADAEASAALLFFASAWLESNAALALAAAASSALIASLKSFSAAVAAAETLATISA